MEAALLFTVMTEESSKNYQEDRTMLIPLAELFPNCQKTRLAWCPCRRGHSCSSCSLLHWSSIKWSVALFLMVVLNQTHVDGSWFRCFCLFQVLRNRESFHGFFPGTNMWAFVCCLSLGWSKAMSDMGVVGELAPHRVIWTLISARCTDFNVG